MRTVIRLHAAELNYPTDLQVHTAASGPVPALSARFLEIERSDGFGGAGEVRANISYLSHLPEEAVNPAILDVCRRLTWSAEPEAILSQVQSLSGVVPPVATAAVENTLVEGIAQREKVPVAQWLGGHWRAAVETNQCLFWGPDETFDRLTERFLGEGFRQIKVRIAVASFDQDLKRLRRLRDRAGSQVSIAVDANGAWSGEDALEGLRALEP